MLAAPLSGSETRIVDGEYLPMWVLSEVCADPEKIRKAESQEERLKSFEKSLYKRIDDVIFSDASSVLSSDIAWNAAIYNTIPNDIPHGAAIKFLLMSEGTLFLTFFGGVLAPLSPADFYKRRLKENIVKSYKAAFTDLESINYPHDFQTLCYRAELKLREHGVSSGYRFESSLISGPMDNEMEKLVEGCQGHHGGVDIFDSGSEYELRIRPAVNITEYNDIKYPDMFLHSYNSFKGSLSNAIDRDKVTELSDYIREEFESLR